ncbi:hypothetical protein ATW69_09660 [Oenococcus oeni]|uniref:glycosyltransferase family 2 protein n=1 Tax=Oenococcus oeni TaxID=1247 RepID=UPI0008F8663F|nr:glycosyltransferase family 2 protein [Oenococcus oeni]OIL68620.1 hypothetical protein ATX30_07455 [Oenococcus oeni]OIM47696.1 hypothetical protein ATX76_07515 [Oenococcus oeni]OLQ32728.1 hypothetical protein ATW69_09660 [Oenococcus oeni]
MNETLIKQNVFVILNFNTYKKTIYLVKKMLSILPITPDQLIVVDNNSTNESAIVLKRDLPRKTTFIESAYNGGYAYGNNIGIKKAIKTSFKYITIMNNDIDIFDDFLTPLLYSLSKNEEIAMIGPVYYNTDGTVHSYGATNDFFRGRTKFVTTLDTIIKFNGPIIDFDWISGAVLCFRCKLISLIGFIPEMYFLNYEENDWQQKARRKKMRISVNLKSHVVHESGGTIRHINGMQEYFMLRNKIIFIRRNANFLQKIAFYFYLTIGTIKSIMINPKNLRRIRIYLDAFTGENRYVTSKNEKGKEKK